MITNNIMYSSDNIKRELEYFKKLHETFTVQLGKNSRLVKNVDDKVLYMLLSASLAMDVSEEEFFESFVITDKAMTGRNEYLIDAYALVNTDDSREKHLHFFQFKIFEENKHAASPKEVYQFASLINDIFLHPELAQENTNEVILEIRDAASKFINANRRNKIKYKCHYINNVKGITKSNQKDFELLNRFNYDKETHGFDVQVFGIAEIEDLAIEGKIRVDTETLTIEIEGPNSYRHENNMQRTELGLPGQTIVGMVNVNELIRLQNKYHRNQLYSENIRLYLGDRAAVNKDIIATITSEESQWFPYMNNGISIICDKLKLGTPTTKSLSIDLDNMQIINGCQTVNALYSAKYSEDTKDNFKASKVLVKIYQIEPKQERFKLSIIKATNNQNAVKTSSLVANDPIQIEIQKKLDILGFLYDRKGEAKVSDRDRKVVNIVNAALAYRAVFWFAAQQLRSGIGQGRVFKNEEYKKLFKSEYLEAENVGKLNFLAAKLLISALLLDKIRVLITLKSDTYKTLPIFKKSLYYLSGLYYAEHKDEIDQLINEIVGLTEEKNPSKIKNYTGINNFSSKIDDDFDSVVKGYENFYSTLTLDKGDIDNLLKSSSFGKAYKEIDAVKKAFIDSAEDNESEID
jgi:hypothetical protein